MLHTIEVQIDANGHIQPVDLLVRLPAGRGLLTLLDDNTSLTTAGKQESGNNFNDLFGIITATNTASLDDMKQAIHEQAQERFINAVESFKIGWQEVQRGEYHPIETLWDDIKL